MTPELCVGAVAVIRDRRMEERILLIRRGRGVAAGEWSIPGGRVEFGETLAAAVVREVYEETGLEVIVDRPLGWVERIGDDYHYLIVDFTVTALEPDTIRAGDDASEAAWVAIDDLDQYRIVDGLIDFLAEHGIIRTIV
jgi:8-oxo-dGTP diphosphatase